VGSVRAPEVILFDAAGTLFHLPRGVGWHYADVARRHGAEFDAGALERAFRSAWKQAAAPEETDGPRPDDNRSWWRGLVEQVLDRVGGDASIDRGAFFTELWEEFAKPGVWELFPETRAVVSKVANRYRLGVLSNFDSRLHTILNHLGLAHFFEHVVVSSEVGAEKPSARMFGEALDRFDVLAEEVLHVGDEPEADWRGAREAGLRVFELRRPENSLRDLFAEL
jgi:putative hydrolase of the HAD superfamily